MLERVVLDANAILNAAFVPQSWLRLVVLKLAHRSKVLLIGSRTLSEAVAAARKIASDLGKRSDPAVILEQFITELGAIEVPPSTDVIDEQIPLHDRHVVQEAITAAATILTSDAALWNACHTAGYRAIAPLEALRLLDGMSLATTTFGVAPGKQTGSIFARVYPGTWAGRADVGKFTVVHFPGRLWLHYCTHRQAWINEMPEVGRIVLPAEVIPATMHTVAVSWQAGKSMLLRVATVEAPAEVPMRQPLDTHLVESATIGIHASQDHSWFGAINVCVVNDRPIGAKLWATLRAPSWLTPNPYDSDRLRRAIYDLVR